MHTHTHTEQSDLDTHTLARSTHTYTHIKVRTFSLFFSLSLSFSLGASSSLEQCNTIDDPDVMMMMICHRGQIPFGKIQIIIIPRFFASPAEKKKNEKKIQRA